MVGGNFDVLEWKELRKKLPQVFNGLFFCASCELMRIFGTRCFLLQRYLLFLVLQIQRCFLLACFAMLQRPWPFVFRFGRGSKSTEKMTGGVCRKSQVLGCFPPSPFKRIQRMRRVVDTPLKINIEHNHGGLEDHFPF